MARDAMEFINEQDPATLQRFVERLEARGADPTFTGYRDAYLAELKLPDSATALEIGCGTGVIARALAARPGFSGRIIATDQSPALLEAGRALAQAEGVAERIEFRACDAHTLPFPDGTFDALIAHTVVSHVTDPLAVLREAARVTRADALIAVFDGDYASLAFGSRDAALGRAMVEAWLDGLRTAAAEETFFGSCNYYTYLLHA